MSNYDSFVEDFAERTFDNLQKLCERGTKFEVTQLINSLVGMLVFPKEDKPQSTQWDFPNNEIKNCYTTSCNKYTGHIEKYSGFFAMVCHLRNSLAHKRIIPFPDSPKVGDIEGFVFTDFLPDGKTQTAEYRLTIKNIFNIEVGILYEIIGKEKFNGKLDKIKKLAQNLKVELDFRKIVKETPKQA